MSDLARGTVAVIGQRFDDDSNAAGTVALVGNSLIVGGLAALCLFDDTIDVIVRYICRLRLGDTISELGVDIRVSASAVADRYHQLSADLGEYLRAGSIILTLFLFDRAPFIMS